MKTALYQMVLHRPFETAREIGQVKFQDFKWTITAFETLTETYFRLEKEAWASGVATRPVIMFIICLAGSLSESAVRLAGRFLHRSR